MERKWEKKCRRASVETQKKMRYFHEGAQRLPNTKKARSKRDPAREQHGKASLKKTLLLHHHFWREEKDDNDATTHAGELK